MPKIKRSSIDDVRNRASIYDVVSAHVTLKRAGAKWKGLSPFTHEKTPSFYVDPQKNFYYCFSSGQGGDIFKFVQTKENLTFQEAVEALAQRFGITLEYEEGGGPMESPSLRKELFEIHESATAHFHSCLLRGGADGDYIRNYWTKQRRFTSDLAREFKIGWAPADGGGLAAALAQKRFSLEAIAQSGLFFVRDGEREPSRWKPRFRGRLMIPIRDIQGRVIAFTARQTEHTPADDPAREAKYVNSPETPLFRKGDVLFNLDRARTPVLESGRFVLVEGQLDALRCWSSGVTSAVAPQGTAMTENQFQLMRRHAGSVDILLDGDEAGQRAALRALPLALKTGLEIRYLPMPLDSDPDEFFLEHGAAGLKELESRAESAMAFAMRSLLPDHNPSAREKADALNALYEILVNCPSEVTREECISEACKRLGTERKASTRDFERFLKRHNRGVPLTPTPLPNDKLTTAEYELLMIVLHHEELGQRVANLVDPQWINTDECGRLLDRCLAAHREDAWPGIDQFDELLDNEDDRNNLDWLLSYSFKDDDFRLFKSDDLIRDVNECLKAIFENHFRRELNELKTRATNTPLKDRDTHAAITARTKEIRNLLRHPPSLDSK